MTEKVTESINETEEKSRNDTIQNLENLGINTEKTEPNRETVTTNIHNPSDIEKINEENLKDYLPLPNSIPVKNYPYIVNNLKDILRKYIIIYPGYYNIIGDKLEKMTNGTLKIMNKRNEQMSETYAKLGEIIRGKTQKERIIKALNTKDELVIDLWIKYERELRGVKEPGATQEIIDTILPGSDEMTNLYEV